MDFIYVQIIILSTLHINIFRNKMKMIKICTQWSLSYKAGGLVLQVHELEIGLATRRCRLIRPVIFPHSGLVMVS
jgi:hypothetical protein